MRWSQSVLRGLIFAGAVLLSLSVLAEDQSPWPASARGVLPVANEHPRLFFRKADLERIRQRAATHEGQAIVHRLKVLLGGGEAMPSIYSKAQQAYANEDESLPVGAYTLWHGAGFGMLYQLTSDVKYADLGRQCVEKAFAGQRDRDDRYAWVHPGGFLRAGPSLAAIAMAYDLCFDGWDAQFRSVVARALLDYDDATTRDGGGKITLDRMALDPKLKPSSNHFGCQVGGAGLALLAIRGDDGVNESGANARIEKLLAGVEKNIRRALTEGFGDGGYFWEHPGPGQIASDTAFVPMLQAMRVAGGKDFITPRPNAQWLTLHWGMEIIVSDGQPYYPNRHPSSYGTEYFERYGLSRGGQFAQGFGAIDEAYKPVMLWVYQHFIEPAEPNVAIPKGKNHFADTLLMPGEKSFDAILYPHRAVLALVNWPIGTAPVNPESIFPHAARDSIMGYYTFRNRWQDQDDILVTALLGARGDSSANPILVWGLGLRTQFPVLLGRAKADYYDALTDGSAIVGVPTGRDGHYSFAVDFSGKSGAPLMIVMAGGMSATKAAAVKGANDVLAVTSIVPAGEVSYTVLTLSRGPVPVPRAEGKKLVIGQQTMEFNGSRLTWTPGVPSGN